MRRLLLIGAPIVAVLTLMLGMRIGAGEAVYSASVFAAPPTQGRVALQILTYYEERSVRETTAMHDLLLVATANGGKKEARWKGDSNHDGIAEANLVFDHDPVTTDGDLHDIHVELRVTGEKQPLAAGDLAFPTTPWGRSESSRAAARPAKRVGSIPIDVLVEGERLVPGFESSIWIHAPGATSITVEPEPGLEVQKTQLTPCDAEGWAEVVVNARAHIVGFKVLAGDSEWYGPLPVAPGAFFVGMPRVVPEGKPIDVVLVAPNPRHVVYAEVDDTNGRAYAAALPVALDPGDSIPRAKMTVPPLMKGLHWLVVSGEPRGAEHLAGAAVAKPFRVGGPPGASQDSCVLGPWLAQRPADGFARSLALDGMAVRGAQNRKAHRLGLLIGLISLAAAALLDVLLLIAAAREARAVTLLADLDDDADQKKALTAKPPGGSIAIALLLAVLGFALLAVLLFMKG